MQGPGLGGDSVLTEGDLLKVVPAADCSVNGLTGATEVEYWGNATKMTIATNSISNGRLCIKLINGTTDDWIHTGYDVEVATPRVDTVFGSSGSAVHRILTNVETTVPYEGLGLSAGKLDGTNTGNAAGGDKEKSDSSTLLLEISSLMQAHDTKKGDGDSNEMIPSWFKTMVMKAFSGM